MRQMLARALSDLSSSSAREIFRLLCGTTYYRISMESSDSPRSWVIFLDVIDWDVNIGLTNHNIRFIFPSIGNLLFPTQHHHEVRETLHPSALLCPKHAKLSAWCLAECI
ncbi:hypothetical protein DPMN_139328 [Dreissena polymorpha]|uniref:Uncharacterized protein n=1 Tax=Dreissena polymorpha TaxID=45954 RepID=A0A9D4G8C9_DREPO|nr:hypothetical protein DPMN_139328 [Dreissena polymorpha]